jgi:transposase
MHAMPKRIDEKVKTCAVRLVSEHVGEYPSLTVASVAGARQLGVGKESVRRGVLQAQVDGGRRQGVTTEDLVEIKTVNAKVHRWEQDNAIVKAATASFEDVPSSVELRWRPDDHQAAFTVSS